MDPRARLAKEIQRSFRGYLRTFPSGDIAGFVRFASESLLVPEDTVSVSTMNQIYAYLNTIEFGARSIRKVVEMNTRVTLRDAMIPLKRLKRTSKRRGSERREQRSNGSDQKTRK